MRYKLLAMDLDDTLLTSSLRISPKTKAYIQAARQQGVIITLSTGRMFSSAQQFARELGLDVPLIVYNGAMIKTSCSEEILYHRTLRRELAERILAFCEERGLYVQMYVNDRLCVKEINDKALEYARVARVELHPVGDLRKFLREDPTKILIIAKPEEVAALMPELQEMFAGKAHLTTSKPYYLEFLHPEVSKGHALRKLAGRLGIKPEEIIAVGDSYNDLEMLSFAGLGVAMGNARPDVKACADYVTCGNDEDGVAEVIARFILDRAV